MPLPAHILQEIGEARDAAQRRAARERFWSWTRTLALCLFWCLLGMYLVGWAFHTTSTYYGTIAFWSGLFVGDGGVLFTFLIAWRKAEARGDYGPPA